MLEISLSCLYVQLGISKSTHISVKPSPPSTHLGDGDGVSDDDSPRSSESRHCMFGKVPFYLGRKPTECR